MVNIRDSDPEPLGSIFFSSDRSVGSGTISTRCGSKDPDPFSHDVDPDPYPNQNDIETLVVSVRQKRRGSEKHFSM